MSLVLLFPIMLFLEKSSSEASSAVELESSLSFPMALTSWFPSVLETFPLYGLLLIGACQKTKQNALQREEGLF